MFRSRGKSSFRLTGCFFFRIDVRFYLRRSDCHGRVHACLVLIFAVLAEVKSRQAEAYPTGCRFELARDWLVFRRSEQSIYLDPNFQGVTVNTIGAEVPPPGAGVNTVTLTFLAVLPGPAEKTFPEGIVAVSWFGPTYVVVCDAPSHLTMEHGTKELPFTVSVNVGEPAGTDVAVPTGGGIRAKLCEIELIPGAGRLPGVVSVKSTELDGAWPEGLLTVIGTGLVGNGDAVSAAEMEAVS
jgi:hypothetical protein